ncbi:Uncharacterized conserved protein, DUF305 family [Arthrobacter subterraneus]|uniref:Uncharacterized conserved protein, DUF305 family n=1 Tax=Arthrobacter subterraneus TaxID=335973 RepID=A0A1G8MV82_9MICC|nr:DUF305 domain-containing protein [Arthrobacter subterraneus]SDI71939.1 Uncharacterized conserved protein, DUF305 family [Arthrobacter subterraneus]
MKRYLSLSALGVAAVVSLAGCGAGAESQPGPAGSSGGSSSSSSPESAAHNDADVMFAQMMIPHHQQAVEMSDMVLAKEGINPEVMDLATRIKDAQAPEVETMTGWLEAWGEPMAMDGGMEGHSMEGMLSQDQLAELESAEADDAARMFLETMTAHHEGAVAMAQEEIENGENPDAIALAEAIVAAQEAEIEEMRALLAGP